MRPLAISLVVLAACTGGPHYTSFDASGDDIDAALQIDAGVDGAIDADPVDARVPDAMPAGPLVTNGQSAELVLGQPNFTSATENNGGVTARSLRDPNGITSDGTYLWVVDSANYRALRWTPLPTTSNANANQVLGKTSMTDGTLPSSSGSATTLRLGKKAVIHGNKLIISDGSRVLMWTSLPTSNGQAADRILCHTTFSGIASGTAADRCSAASGLWTDGVRLALADSGNNRVLIWTTFPTTNGQAADIVLGQINFDVSTAPSVATASNMRLPRGVHFDGSRFYVADTYQNRVMVWNGFPTTNNQPANLVIGQPNLTSKDAATTQSGLNLANDVAVVGDALFVADYLNDRVMIWAPIPTTSGQPASYVLGASNYTTAGGSPAATQANLDGPTALSIVGNKLFVADSNHHRVLRFGLNLP